MKNNSLLIVFLLAVFSVSAMDANPRGEAEDIQYFRNLWAKRIQGNNLAKGKKVTFSIPTNYKLTNDENDPFDLTDGKISPSRKELIWFGKEPVGWFGGVSDGGVNFLIDLGEVKNVDRLVIRCLGGEVQKTLGFPKRFEVYVSKDGKNYYRTAMLQKLEEADRELSDFKTSFYLPQNGKAYVYPFELDINAETRYVAFTIASAAGGLFSDELAVIEGNPRKKDFNAAYKTQSMPFYTKGVLIRPKQNVFALSKNIITPVFLTYCDMRSITQRKSPMMLELDFPSGITALSPKAQKTETYTDKNGKKRVKITMTAVPRPWSGTMLKPMFFKVDKKNAANDKVYLTSYSSGVEPIRQEFPLQIIDIAPVPQLKRLHVSLAWMGDDDARQYPDFFNAWQTIGFNAVNGFPRYFGSRDKAARENFFAEARKRGMKIIMTDSPIHAMPGKDKKGHEMNCLNNTIVAVCPSYKGDFHKKEVERIKNCVINSKPDYVFFDIEAFYNSHTTAKKCSRCLAAMKEAKMTSMDNFTKKAVAEKMADFRTAVVEGAKAVNIPAPPIGLYGKGPGTVDLSQPVLNWELIYPASIAVSQPSLYIGERPYLVQERIRKTSKLMKNRNIIPWLTAGTYGEMRPQFVEYIALEALLNGAGGMTYYAYWDFDTPLEYAALAKALRMVAPYEDLLMDGELVEIKVNGVDTSAIRKGDEMLLLVGNYRRPDMNVSIKLPFRKVISVKDLRDGEKFTAANSIKLNVPRSSIRLLYVKGK